MISSMVLLGILFLAFATDSKPDIDSNRKRAFMVNSIVKSGKFLVMNLLVSGEK